MVTIVKNCNKIVPVNSKRETENIAELIGILIHRMGKKGPIPDPHHLVFSTESSSSFSSLKIFHEYFSDDILLSVENMTFLQIY